MNPSTRQLIGVSWRDNRPFVRVCDDREHVSRLVAAVGLRLNYRIGSEPVRRCLGHTPFRAGDGAYHDCSATPELGKRTCSRCAIVEATFASNLHHAHTRGTAELDPAIRNHLRQPNRLYVAGFRDGSIKVGTSTMARAERRLQEQGAWSARFVAETDNGITVRRLEDRVTDVIGTPQSVSARRKARGLVRPVPDAELDARLDAVALKIQELVGHDGDHGVVLLGVDPSTTRVGQTGIEWRHPSAHGPAIERLLDYPLSLTSGNHDLEVMTAVGRLLVVRRPVADDLFVIDPAPLFGIELDIGDYGSDEIAIQDSLF